MLFTTLASIAVLFVAAVGATSGTNARHASRNLALGNHRNAPRRHNGNGDHKWTHQQKQGRPSAFASYNDEGAASSSSTSVTTAESAQDTARLDAVLPMTSRVVTSTTTTAPATSPTPSSGTYSGEGTYFYQNNTPGACGTVHQDSDQIIALDSAMYSSSNCGRTVSITNTANGNTVTATVADECPTCASAESIDLSVATFEALGALSTGVLDVTWSFTS